MTFTRSLAGIAAPPFARPVVKTEASTGTMPPRRAWPIGLLGVPFDHVTKAEAVARIEAMIATRRPHHVVTANVDFLVQAQRDVELRRILLEADLVLCDGTPLLWASRWLGNPLPERAAGADVVPLLMSAAAAGGHRVFLLGAGPGIAAEAAARLQQRHPTLTIAGHFSPPFRNLLDMDFAEIERRVRDARPDIVLVSFGCPKQEKWIAMHYRRLGVPVLMGVGATLDFIAGRMTRAPALMQRTGTECLYRLAQEPRRLARRYLSDFIRFVPAIARQRWSLRAPPGPSSTAHSITVEGMPPGQQIRVAGDLSAATLHRERTAFDAALQAGGDCQLDLSQVRSIDSTGIAVLLHWHRRLHREGRRLTLLNPSRAVERILPLMRLTGYFHIVTRSTGTAPQADVAASSQPVIPPYPGGHTVAWQGEITAVNVETVWSVTVGHLAAAGLPPHQTFIIDLSRLRFIDSAGAELMRRLRTWARELNHELWFPGAQPGVRNVLRLARLGELLETPRR